MSEEDLASVDLHTMLGVQKALTMLGLDPGATDGFDGPHTQKAVKAFQEGASIGVDGIVGPQTREALAQALRDVAHRAEDVARDGGADGNTSGADGGTPPAT